MKTVDLVIGIAGFVAALLAFLNREWAEVRAHRDTLSPSNGRTLYPDIDEVLTAIEDEESLPPTAASRVVGKAKRAFRFVAVVVMVGAMMTWIVPSSAVGAVVFTTVCAVVGVVVGALVAVVFSLFDLEGLIR